MAILSTTVNELLKGIKAEENLKNYSEGLFSLYKRMGLLRLSMNYFTFSEIYSEMEEEKRNVLLPTLDKVQEILRISIFEPEMMNDSIEQEIEVVRNEIIRIMEVLTEYVDKFQIYEYMLNRIEYRYEESGFSNDYYKEKFARDILHYITNEDDNVVINMKIAQVISQLPMRISRNKFYDMIKEACSLYQSSDQAALEDFIYRIKTSGGLFEVDKTIEEFSDLYQAYESLENIDYDNMDKETYDYFRKMLDEVSIQVQEYSDFYVMLGEVVNDLYTLILTGDCFYEKKEEEQLKNIVKDSYKVINHEIQAEDLSPELFEPFEGLQEKIGSQIMAPENTLDEICSKNEEAIQKLGFESIFKKLKMITKLQSVSVFATLSQKDTVGKSVTQKQVLESAVELSNKFAEVFKTHGKLYRRGVMSSVISNLPLFFNNFEEVKAYIISTLEQCRDDAERQSCMALIGLMISSE